MPGASIVQTEGGSAARGWNDGPQQGAQWNTSSYVGPEDAQASSQPAGSIPNQTSQDHQVDDVPL